MRLIPDGTRFTLPPEWEWRETLRSKLERVLSAWGYEAVQTPSLEVYARAENILDQRYQEVYGFQTAGAAVYGGVRLSLQDKSVALTGSR